MTYTMTEETFHIPSSRYVEALQRNGVDYFVTMPDWVQLALHQRLDQGAEGIRVVYCCNEDQAVSVSAGLRISGKNPIVAIQNQGLYACVNSIRAVALDAGIPVVFLIGQFGREFANFGKSPALSRRRMVSLLEPVLDTLGIRYWRLEREADLASFDEAIEYARETRRSAALLVGAPIGWN